MRSYSIAVLLLTTLVFSSSLHAREHQPQTEKVKVFELKNADTFQPTLVIETNVCKILPVSQDLIITRRPETPGFAFKKYFVRAVGGARKQIANFANKNKRGETKGKSTVVEPVGWC